jgi:ABC-type Na+ transport system ATPase subunit NatA
VSGVVFRDPVVDRALTGRAHLELDRRLWGMPSAQLAVAIADLVDALSLGDLVDRPIGRYSAASAAACGSPPRWPRVLRFSREA